MKVFTIEGDGCFAGGFAIVAAEDADKAREIAAKELQQDSWYEVKYHESKKIKELPVSYDGDACVLSHFEIGE